MRPLGFRRQVMTFAAAMGLGLAVPAIANAQAFELAAAPMPIMGSDDVELTLQPDGTAQEVRTRRIKLLTEAGRQVVAKQAIAYRSALQTVTVVEAYTLKRDGTRVDVDPKAILTRDIPSNDVDAADGRIRTVIFPSVTVGDTVVLTVRKETKKAIFPGNYAEVFGAENLIANTVRVTGPKDMSFTVGARGDEYYEHRVVYDEATVTHTVRHPAIPISNTRPNESGAVAASQSDMPHILVSTFKDYWAVGRAAWAMSKSRIESTPEIAAKAEDITAGITDRRAQAEAIDNWIKRNIRYVALEIGMDSMIPHRASAILRMGYGDCKDHATLMAALLAVKGIDSELVLIHAGNSYALPEPAFPGAFNHMMIYLPEFSLYDDPTAHMATFGTLMPPTYDQPVVRISGKHVVVGRTPVMRMDDHVAINRTTIKVAADGSITGTTKESLSGMFATMGRTRAADIVGNKGLDDGAASELRANGNPGQGLFEIDEETSLAEPFVVKGKFDLGRIKVGPGANAPIPVGLALAPRPGPMFFGQMQPRQLPFVCLSGRQIEEIEITFADGLPLPKPIAPSKISNAAFAYVATAKLANRTLSIRREFIAHVPGQICAAERGGDIARAMSDVIANLRAPITFEDKRPILQQLKDQQADAGNRRSM